MKTNYLDQLRKYISPDVRTDLYSRNICPYLLYQIFPYCLTLIEGGWFEWVPRGGETSTRENTFSRLWGQRPNSAFVNEVLVRCPNQNAGIIIGIGPDSESNLKIRLLHVEGHCRMGYHTGDVLNWGKKDLDKDEIFVRNFPELMGNAFGGKYEMRPCHPAKDQKEASITTKQIHTPCRYHRQKTIFSGRTAFAGGLCPAAFQVAYPRALGAYYGARPQKESSIFCPNGPKGSTGICVKTKQIFPAPCHELLDRLATLIGSLLHPVDPLLYSLAFTISTVASHHCIHLEKEEFKFNLRSKKILCPASAYSLYPYLTLSADARKKFIESGAWSDMVCPDFVGTSYTLKT